MNILNFDSKKLYCLILVVNQKKKLPGDWYFELYEAMHPGVMYRWGNHIKSELKKLYAYQDWHVVAKRYGLSENLLLQLKLRSLRLKD